MAEMNGKNITDRKRRLSINLSFFTLYENPAKSSIGGGGGIKSPKNFEEPNGVVGLGILAAMNKNDTNNFHDQFLKRAAVLAVSPRSTNPIPILSNKKHTSSLSTKNNKTGFTKRPSVEEMELCEEYTCVISRGDNQIKKIEYFDDGLCFVNENLVVNDESVEITANISAAVSRGCEAKVFQMADFLSSCFLCDKKLHGLDIFMYRGEKAFCSVECRYKQIAIDEHKEKCVCVSGATRKQHEYSVSPCSNTMQFFAGVAAA